MNILQNFLESNHTFSDNELPLKFKFRLLNTIMGVIVITAIAFVFLHYFGIAPIGDFHANVNLFFAITNTLLILWLRKDITAYNKAVTLLLISSLITFTSALITIPGDEMRIMWFYITVFLAFFSGGIIYGYMTAAASVTIILVSNTFFDLNLSELAITTAVLGLFLLTIAIKVYTQKMIDLENALTTLNNSLHAKVERNVDEIRKKDEAMLQQARLAQMGELIAMIAHQWRQPLNQMSYVLMNIESAYEYKEMTPQYMDTKVKEGTKLLEYMSHTIDDFKNFFKPDKARTQENVSEVVENSISLIKKSFDAHNIEVSTRYETQKSMMLYRNELIQVLLNLLSNAKDALVMADVEEPVIEVVVKEMSGHLVIEVCDNATGVPNNIIDKIFEPYFSTKNEKNGTGLGLYMTKTIVEEHLNGSILVKNRGVGACFSITLK